MVRPTPRSILFFLALFQAVVVVFAVHFLHFRGSVPNFREASGGGALLDTRPEFTVEAVYARLASYGDAGRLVYSFRLFTVDLLLPVSLLAFFLPAAAYSAKVFQGPGWKILVLGIPWLFFLADLAENSTLFALLDRFPERSEGLAAALPWFSSIKRAGMIGSIVLPIAALVISVRRRKE